MVHLKFIQNPCNSLLFPRPDWKSGSDTTTIPALKSVRVGVPPLQPWLLLGSATPGVSGSCGPRNVTWEPWEPLEAAGFGFTSLRCLEKSCRGSLLSSFQHKHISTFQILNGCIYSSLSLIFGLLTSINLIRSYTTVSATSSIFTYIIIYLLWKIMENPWKSYWILLVYNGLHLYTSLVPWPGPTFDPDHGPRIAKWQRVPARHRSPKPHPRSRHLGPGACQWMRWLNGQSMGQWWFMMIIYVNICKYVNIYINNYIYSYI